MGYTISQKILAAHCGRDRVSHGEIINAKVDYLIAGEINAPICIKDFNRLENPAFSTRRAWSLSRIVMPLTRTSSRRNNAG
jgi:homoaconitase/3-isopropylmalate dehydratase large subunit